MGADWYSQSVVGVRVKNPRIDAKARGCSHPEQNSKFCSECGAKTWVSSNILNPKLDELENSKHPSGLQVCTSTDGEEYFVGIYSISTSSNRSGGTSRMAELPPIINIQEIKVKLMTYLGDLYDEKEFGLWTVLYCSY